MGKHSVQRESRMPASVKSAIVFGAVATGSFPAIQASAAPVDTPFGKFELGVSQDQVDAAVQQVNQAAPGLLPQAAAPGQAAAAPNLMTALGQLQGTNTKGDAAVNAAKSKIGARYVWGATGGADGRSFDCSGLVQWAYKQAGVSIPRTSFEQAHAGRPVALHDLRPGDILITRGGGHSQIYAGHGQVIEAMTSGVPVKYSNVDLKSVYAARRV